MADATSLVRSIQKNIKNTSNTNRTDMTKYALFLGGMDVTNGALQQYDPLRTGYARVFFIRKPKFLKDLFSQQGGEDIKRFNSFWHTLEYGFISVDGIQNTSLETEQISGGYAGKSFEVPVVSRDETNSITIRVYESAGSPIREMLDLWITGIADPHTGLSHYHGMLDKTPLSQANHTAEMLYVQTDPTGNSNGIEYACLIANMVPKVVKKDHFNHESGSHPLVQTDIEFTATKYESLQINEVAKELLKRQTILSNYTYFESEYNANNAAISGRESVVNSSWGTNDAARTK